jgi:hypothetical protein
MLSIPSKLMITPLNILNDPVMGDIFNDARDILRGQGARCVTLTIDRRLLVDDVLVV